MILNDQARFFIVYPMGLEDLGLIELKAKFQEQFSNEEFNLIAKIAGGLEIECQLNIGLSLNTILRTPTRILIRIGEFKCRDAPKLFQKISKFNWAPWLIGQIPDVEVATINSRLFDSRKIEKAIQDGIQQFYRHKPLKKKYLEHLATSELNNLPKIYFRSVDDICTLSLDTTGERLHKRGEKILTGLAPIRESLAALLLVELETHLKNEQYTLIDPMCGSGTFLIEALESKMVTTERNFSFKHIPIVLDNMSTLKKLESVVQLKYKHIIGYDIDPNVVSLAKKNCNQSKITIEQVDLFSPQERNFKNDNVIVVLNPPYGIRVGEKNEINLAYYLKIIEKIKTNFAPELLGIIVPGDYKLKPNNLFNIETIRPFKNGGIEVVFYVLGFK